MTVINLPNRKKNYPEKLELIEEILPNIKKYEGESIVIHLDGPVLYDDDLLKKFANDVTLLKRFGAHPIIVHNGEKFVEEQFNKLGFEFKVEEGIIVTDKNSIDALEMVLKGFVSSKIVSAINDAGGAAVGLSGKDASLIEAKKFRKYKSRPNSNIQNIIDFGFNGEPTVINPELLLLFEDSKTIPVISSIARGENGETFHINSLISSSIIASSIVAGHYIVFTENRGVVDGKGNLIKNIDSETFEKNKNSYNIEGSICENICCVLENQVGAVHVINSRVPHALLLELFTDEEVGTVILQVNDEDFII